MFSSGKKAENLLLANNLLFLSLMGYKMTSESIDLEITTAGKTPKLNLLKSQRINTIYMYAYCIQ